MKLFLQILQYYIDDQNGDDNLRQTNIIIQIIKQTILSKQIHLKHETFFQYINNIFISKEQKQQILTIFQKSQKIYLSLVKFANQVRYKIAKERITTDLRMDPIDPNSRYAYAFVQMGSKYWFLLSDLINIIQTPIINSENIFPAPSFPKNPYNNIMFTKTDLYNMYYKIKNTYATVPRWIQLFFEAGFELNKFILDNEMQLREQYIKHFIHNGDINDLYREIINMLKQYNTLFLNFEISQDFPKKEFVEIFRPYLLLYMYDNDYIHGTEKRYNAENVIYRCLQKFAKFNENFGKKNVTLNSMFVYDSSANLQITDMPNSNNYSRKTVYKCTFNNNHPTFTLSDAYNLLYKHSKIKNNNSMEVNTFRQALMYYESINGSNSHSMLDMNTIDLRDEDESDYYDE